MAYMFSRIISRKSAFKLTLLSMLLLSATGCGQKGPLKLPAPDSEPAQESAQALLN
ncbi:LPS translocon maturation chaperone LptM [Teredinibacter haidensis]|uniref:LPS translocon maturation chaperone LptM n=1 Tax=Teredinibacter haidensis TaxID=2731755 RepID=UPI000ACE3409|nr:lipoprotein [Teredinibacter haidensis]